MVQKPTFWKLFSFLLILAMLWLAVWAEKQVRDIAPIVMTGAKYCRPGESDLLGLKEDRIVYCFSMAHGKDPILHGVVRIQKDGTPSAETPPDSESRMRLAKIFGR